MIKCRGCEVPLKSDNKHDKCIRCRANTTCIMCSRRYVKTSSKHKRKDICSACAPGKAMRVANELL